MQLLKPVNAVIFLGCSTWFGGAGIYGMNIIIDETTTKK